ncbi:unnamed protein product [Penicillium glandicola]
MESMVSMQVPSPELGDSATPHRVGQACDRCRRKKIKCDGAFPSCRGCEKAGLVCEVSATLRRQTKVRGFTSDEQRMEQLQAELARCKQKLKEEQDRTTSLRQELSRKQQPRPPFELEAQAGAVEPAVSRKTERRVVDDPTYVIKHMGRLVHDEKGVGRFAGSTTGVHFVLNVEQECQKVLNLSGVFPESCFRLFLAQPSPERGYDSTMSPLEDMEEMRQCFAYPPAYCCQQADAFIRKWEAFCPVLVQKQVLTDINDLIVNIYDLNGTTVIDYAVVLTLLMILVINELFSDISGLPDQRSASCLRRLSLANRLIDRVTSQGNIKSLQALSLFALYNQLSGYCLSLTSLNGVLVSLAQSLGLHRHARRFKMGVGEIELRKRLWWWIYVFDRITSVFHGLPPLINDVNVDNDIPLDCHLHDLEATELSHPLPGERTAVFIFLQYVSLGKKLSRILDLLYTTTQRRDGATKIADLDRDLRVWNQNLKANGISFDIGIAPGKLPSDGSSHLNDNTTSWLHLMANVTMVMIHRPGLSFDDTTAEFGNCLRVCLDSSNAILSSIGDSHVPKWLQHLSLIGPGILFQTALMHVYRQCKYRISKQPDGLPGVETSMTMISKGISILGVDIRNSQANQSDGNFYAESIGEAIETLQKLLYSLPQFAQGPADTNMLDDQLISRNVSEFDDQPWGANALDALNYMTSSDWMGEVTGPFMGFMDVGDSQVGHEPTDGLGPE